MTVIISDWISRHFSQELDFRSFWIIQKIENRGQSCSQMKVAALKVLMTSSVGIKQSLTHLKTIHYARCEEAVFKTTMYLPCTIFQRTITTPLQSPQTRLLTQELRASGAQLRFCPLRRSAWPDNLATDCLDSWSRKLWWLYWAQFSKYTVHRVHV